MSDAFDVGCFDPDVFDAGVTLPVVGVDVPDLVAEALSRLLEQDKNKPNVAALLTAIVSPLQDVVNACWQLQTQRTLDTAIAAQLDGLGSIEDFARQGLDDDTYRRYLRAKVAADKSDGTVEALIGVAVAALSDLSSLVIVTPQPNAEVLVRIADIVLADAVGAIVYALEAVAAKGGVRIIVQWTTYPLANTFRLDVGPGLDSGHLASAEG